MEWVGKLKSASFRGVPFFVEDHRITGGRKLVEHNLPAQDGTQQEDMGQAPDVFVVNAYVLGSNYLDQKEQLINALKKQGTGKLIHPYRSEVDVVCHKFEQTETAKEGGIAKFNITFKEPGNSELLVATHTPDLVAQNAGVALNGSLNSFKSTFNVNGYQGFVKSEAEVVLRKLNRVVSLANSGYTDSALRAFCD